MALTPIQYGAGQDSMTEVYDKINAIITAVNELQGGTAGQIIKKVDGTDFNFTITDQYPSFTGNKSKPLRVNTAGTDVEFASGVYDSYSLPASRTITSTTYADIPTESVEVVTPNDGVTRNYLILVTGYAQTSDNNAITNSILFTKITGSTLGDVIAEHRIGWSKVSSGEQRSDYYNISMHKVVAIPPNETIKLQAKRDQTNLTLAACELSIIEI